MKSNNLPVHPPPLCHDKYNNNKTKGSSTSSSDKHIFSLLSSDTIYDICKFLSASDIVFNVRSVCRITHRCINIQNEKSDDDGDGDDDRYLNLIRSNIEKYDPCLEEHLRLERLMSEGERTLAACNGGLFRESNDNTNANNGTTTATNVEKVEFTKTLLRLSLKFKYVEMTFKPNEDTHFKIRVTRSILDQFNTSKELDDSNPIVACFDRILKAFKESSLFTTLYHSELMENENDYVVLVGIVSGGRVFINNLYSFACKFESKKSPAYEITNFKGRILSMACQRSYHYNSYNHNTSRFLQILDSVLGKNFIDSMSYHTIWMISQQEFVIPNRKLIISLGSSFDYGLTDVPKQGNDGDVVILRDMPCTLYCDVNPMGRELVYSPSTLKKFLRMTLFRFGYFVGVGLYMGALQYFTRIPSFRFNREYFTSDSVANSALGFAFIAIDSVFALSSGLYASGLDWVEESTLLKTCGLTYALKCVLCGLVYRQSPHLQILKLVHVPPLELVHNAVGFGVLGTLGTTLYKEMDRAFMACVASFTYCKRQFFK